MLDLIYTGIVCVFFLICAWSVYNVPILATGVRNLRRKRDQGKSLTETQPSFSIVVPAKNEEKVIGRLLTALSRLTYPADKMEIIVVEDGSTDKTSEICRNFAGKSLINIRIFNRSRSDGKPSALNYGISRAKGDIIGIFDADNVPAQDALQKVCKYFEDQSVAAVQGRTSLINSEENMLTKFISYEEAVWCEAYLRGKDTLSLFVHLKGSCQFVRRETLEKLNGFDEKALSEDMELSARFTEKGYKIRYASDVRSLQESPADLKQLFRQRIRWFRGTMEVAFKYGRLMAKPSRLSLDAEATLFGPFALIASLITYFAAFYTFFIPFPLSIILQFLMQATAFMVTFTMLVSGLALVYSSKPRKASNVLWLPFVYFYWSLQAFIALYAILLILFRRPRKWLKTDKKGTINRAVVN